MNEEEKILITRANQLDSIGDKKGAVKHYKMALKANKKSVVALTNLATIFYETGSYKEAQNFCQKALKLDSKNVSALINLGNIFYQQREINRSLEYYLQARELKKNYYVTEINLANTYLELKDYNKAIEHALKAAELNPDSIVVQTILGNSYLEISQNDNAIEALLKAKELDSSDAWIDNSLSQAYQKKQQWEMAVKHAWSAVEISRGDDSHNINFGYLLYEYMLETKDKRAVEYADKWLKKYPRNNIVKHMGNSIKNGGNIDRANNEYLTQIFDIFAPDFEEVLSSLDYQVPNLIFEFVKNIYGENKPKKMSILDAGCGTGLCGSFLKKYAKWRGLKGVDISQKMLDVASSKKLYDKLFCEELGLFFSHTKKAFDLIVSADVLTYIGDLENLFLGVKNSLKKNGRIIFSVSENSINNEGFFLDISGRFLHSKNYIQKVLKNAGLEIEKIERHKLRNEGDKEVYGFIVSAKKTAQI